MKEEELRKRIEKLMVDIAGNYNKYEFHIQKAIEISRRIDAMEFEMRALKNQLKSK